MIKTLLFDFNNVLLFQSKATIEAASSEIKKIEIPEAYSPVFYLNQELLKYIEHKKQSYKTVILSASEFTLEQPVILTAIHPYFDRILMAKDFGWAKDLPATYTAAAKELGTTPAEILFTDDKITNVEAAEAVGVTGIHFENNAHFISKLENILIDQA